MNIRPIYQAADADAAAVTAILEGDRDRFRELVERYGNKVFAIAWSRLGDRTMAEDAAQETFITAYRRLSMLGGTEKFGHWVTIIARNTSINLGMRNRRELNKRELWTLENTPDVPTDESADVTAPTPEMLQQSIAGLPQIHRECLVLFYIEDHSVSETASLLGLAEPVVKMRLHRARHALRAVMEKRLEESLENLRPSSKFAGAVMLAVPAGKPAAAMAGGLLGAIAKISPALGSWLFLASPLALLPAQWWIDRKTAENFREQDGFRARDYRKMSRVVFRWCIIGALVSSAIPFAFIYGIEGIARTVNGIVLDAETVALLARSFCGLIALATGIWLCGKWRSVLLTRHRFIIAEWFYHACILGGWAATALMGKPSYIFLGIAGGSLCNAIGTSARPLRMDYSLFHRAMRGMLPTGPPAVATASSPRILREFARFLGKRLLARDWRPHPDGIELLLNLPGFGIASIWYSWKLGHTLVLRENGTVSAHLSELGIRAMARTATVDPADVPELETMVAAAVSRSFASFASGDPGDAESHLGESDSETIFLKNPKSAAGMVWRVTGHLLLAASMFYFFWIG